MDEGSAAPNRSAHVLVVDDDPKIRSMLVRYLGGEGLRVGEAGDGTAMRAYLAANEVDLVLLDLVLPGEDGLALVRDIRAQSNIGIVMITGHGDVIDRVAGLEVGADDYIAKPFHLREVLARIRSVLRRMRPPEPQGVPDAAPAQEVLGFEGWVLAPAQRRLTAPDGREVALTTGEFDLLVAFATHPGRVLDRDQLMDLAKGRTWAAFDRSIDQQVARLRRKIEADPANPSLVRSVRGVGYCFAADVRRG